MANRTFGSRPRPLGPRTAIVLIALIPLLLIGVPGLVNFGTTWLWMREIGFETVLMTDVLTRAALFVGVLLLSWGTLAANLRIAAGRQRPLPALVGDIELLTANPLASGAGRLLHVVAAGLSLLIAISSAAGWLAVQRMINAVPFGVTDPLLGRDVGFYTFTLPVLSGGLTLLTGLAFLSLILSAGAYLVGGGITATSGVVWNPQAGGLDAMGVPPRPQAVNPQLRISPDATRHLAVILAVLLVLLAVQTWVVGIPALVFSTTGPLVGASYADVHARLPGLHVSAVAALLAAGYVLWGLSRGRTGRHAAVGMIAYIAVSILARGIYPALVQRLVVAPTELTRERPYLARHIDATRRAWGLSDVTIGDLRGEATLTLDDIRANGATIENVRLWDRAPLLQTFGQLQEIRTYYDFISIDDDRYWIEGRYRQVLLSPRELNSASLPTRSFINEHLTFTHGMGLTLAPVNQVTSEGLPVLFVKDLPPVATGTLRTTRPQVYFGELTNTYAIVRTRQREFDYPSGDENIFTEYGGTGGVAVGSVLQRAMFAWRFQSLKILLSGDITGDSRILYHRNVVDRAQRALPFVRLDSDPYLVLTEAGHLVWLLDAYTTSASYPYAQRLRDGTSYMRNSVKIAIDAYHGSVTAYISDPADPVIQTYARIFPGILQPMDSMPADLRTHIRYPEDLFSAQVALYAIYHMTDPESFYHREDQWQIPVIGTGEEQNTFMRRIIMRLPDEEKAEFIFMSPYTPRGKDNLASWMVARNDGPQYGKLNVYRFPKQSLVFGPQQIVNRMNQDTEIARQVSLWDQRGSEVIRGALMVIPIEESLIYVQPLYLRAEGGKIPELKRVIVAYQNRVVMEETLDAGLARLFGAGAGTSAAPPTAIADADPATGAPAATVPGASAPVQAALLSRARDHYDRAIAAQRAGDWATYGTEIQRLGEVLRQLAGGNPD